MRYDSFLLVALMRPGGGSGVFLKLRLRRYSSSAISSSAVAADDRQGFSRDVARAMRRCEEDIRRRDFLRLCGPFHRRVGEPSGMRPSLPERPSQTVPSWYG